MTTDPLPDTPPYTADGAIDDITSTALALHEEAQGLAPRKNTASGLVDFLIGLAGDLEQAAVDTLHAALTARDAEIAKLREALQFYADGKHFHDGFDGEGLSRQFLLDEGETARAALEVKETAPDPH